ncbi:hypothetical protein DXG01_014337 [Tephrocybe rancida]|nr:hypothetical protein DXG01_014337 [Tephrocybe rancida]
MECTLPPAEHPFRYRRSTRALTHLAHASYLLITSAPLKRSPHQLTRTVPYDLFAVHSALFVGALLQLGGMFYDHGVFGDGWPSVDVLVALWTDLVAGTGRVLDAIDLTTPTPESRAQAYIHAFLCSLCKSQAGAQHFWCGLRAATCIRSELMTSICDRALKRKYFSGILERGKKAGTEDDGEGKCEEGKSRSKKDEKKSDEAKVKVGVGKIVNLMAGDANRVSMTVSASCFTHSALFEILLALMFLYNLLGLAAFFGFLVLLLGWPLNPSIAHRSIHIQKGLSGARDRRMGVLSERMGAVKFIKFFAWEGKWIDKFMEMRAEEMRQMAKVRVNYVVFSMLWTSIHIPLSVISFFVYVMQDNELITSTAFMILQAGVAHNCIAVYLGEDKISERSHRSRKTRPNRPNYPLMRQHKREEEGLGNENGLFDRGSPADSEGADKDKDKDKEGKTSLSATVIEDEGKMQVLLGEDVSNVTAPEPRDINVRFPEGELSVITGPTASGKTAFLAKWLLKHAPGQTQNVEIAFQARFPFLWSLPLPLPRRTGPLAAAPDHSGQHRAPFNYARYDAVFDACAPRTDPHVLEDGDLTKIGPRGVGLSEGQKARVALARAVYSRARYVLLDDPLNAVDSGNAGWIVENLLKGELLEGRTILVTHHVDLVLPVAHYLVRMLGVRIDTQDTIEDLRAQGVLDCLEPWSWCRASGDQVYYKIKHSTELKKLMGAYATRVGKDVSALQYTLLFL